MSKGFLTFAQNGKDISSPKDNYLRMAYALALSLKVTQPKYDKLTVIVSPDTLIPDIYKEIFDQIIEIHANDNLAAEHKWKLHNEYKAFHLSPYDETIKLAADMLFFSDITEWWELFKPFDFHAATQVRSHRGDIITSDYYRKTFTSNKLPNVYSDFTYFNKTHAPMEIFNLMEKIFRDWETFYMQFLDASRPTYVSTDIVYALALKLLDYNLVDISLPTFTHMKPYLLDIGRVDYWSEHIRMDINSNCECKIGNYRQHFPLHYFEKWVLTEDIIEKYEKKLGI